MMSGHMIERPAIQGRAAVMRDGLVVALALLAVTLGVAFSLPQAAKDATRARAIIFAPWTSGQEAVARTLAAGHRVLRSGISPFIVITAPVDTDLEQTKPQGALLILALDGLAGCLDLRPTAELAS